MNFPLNSFFSSVTFVFAFVTDYTVQKSRADLRLPEEIEAAGERSSHDGRPARDQCRSSAPATGSREVNASVNSPDECDAKR